MPFTIYGPIGLTKKHLQDPESKKIMLLIDGKASRLKLPETSTSTDIGVYVFAIAKQGGGAMFPWYVGKTEKSNLGKESLTSDKLKKYATALELDEGGAPYLYFLVPGNKTDETLIDRLETFLIWLARQRNPGLINARTNLSPHTLEETLRTVRVYGLQHKKRGPVSSSETSFRKAIGWNKPVHIV